MFQEVFLYISVFFIITGIAVITGTVFSCIKNHKETRKIKEERQKIALEIQHLTLQLQQQNPTLKI